MTNERADEIIFALEQGLVADGYFKHHEQILAIERCRELLQANTEARKKTGGCLKCKWSEVEEAKRCDDCIFTNWEAKENG
jgi:hypothetical protein